MDLEALYDRVVDDPRDDTPREAFAAAVEDTHPEWAEFIQVQLALARARVAKADAPVSTAAREAILLDRNRERWGHPVKDLTKGYAFVRGFVDWVWMDAEVFLMFSEDLYRRAPVLHLNLTDAQDVVQELVDDPRLSRIVSLSLVGCDLDDGAAFALSVSPHLAELEWLDLSRNRIGAEGLEALAASSTLPRLGYLGLADNVVPDPTPRFADEYDYTSAQALALQERYGPRAWLDARPRWRWPPERDAVW